MKKLVEKKDISSWRNPTDVDKESIAKEIIKIKKALLEDTASMVIILMLLIFTHILILVGGINWFFITIPVWIIIGVLTIIYYCERIRYNSNILINIKNNKYKISECYINYVEDTKDDGKQAYIHNEINEYCTEPIKIDREVEESIKVDNGIKLYIINIGDRVYRIFNKQVKE